MSQGDGGRSADDAVPVVTEGGGRIGASVCERLAAAGRLAAEDAAYITDQTLSVSGGLAMA